MSNPAKKNKATLAHLPLLIVFLSLVVGLFVDYRPWISITSAILVPALLLCLIVVYTRKDSDSLRLSYLWGLLGLSMLIFGIYADPNHVNPQVISVLISLSGTLISLSIIGVILQLKDTKEYFASTLSDLIMKESYVEKLSRSQLEKLQKTVLERYFENSNDFNRENSFYGFFSRNLQNYIGSPYRENYRNTLSLEAIEENGSTITGGKSCLVSDELTYQLRSMGADLQKNIKWLAAKDEIKKLEAFSVWIGSVRIFEWPAANDQVSDSDLIKHNFTHNPEDGVSLIIQLDKLAQSDQKIKKEYVDGAIVRISAKYLATNFKSITAKLLFPTKGFSLSVFHSSEMRCKVEPYGFTTDTHACEHNITPQGFTFDYSDWMLPYSGVYVAVEEIDVVGQKALPTIGSGIGENVAIDASSTDGQSVDYEEESVQ
ncbi:hypothetical protein M6D76_08820 [Alcaligenes faecalis]|uniref:hypothetical protein n=1 Tax=Alcaligenes faecalis TaxID=511 RepID=UPI00211CD78A|nr:hypothetical protein [Alcaligenes faecalis]UUO12764.1 hypothetical protein M6D76_08820 [Alcaligenes faecalis]